MKTRLAVIEGVRTPFCKANGVLKDIEADDLGSYAVKEVINRSGIDTNSIDELIFGNVIQPPHATNIARVLSVKGGVPEHVPALTVNRNCASGMEAVAAAYNRAQQGDGSVFLVGGTESMSNFPVLIKKQFREFLMKLSKARGWKAQLAQLLHFRPHMLAPDFPKIADPLVGLTMGQTAEVLARDWGITRQEQDEFALTSQQRAVDAIKSGRLAEEIIPIPVPPKQDHMQIDDDGPREGQTIEDLQKLKPVFDRLCGTVTAATSSQITDGAVALIVMTEEKAKSLNLNPIGYIKEHAYAGLDPSRMGLGPFFATGKLLKRTGMKLSDFDLIEINEAFAAQVIAVERAMASASYCQEKLGMHSAIGELDRNKLNVNGGAIALGHPLGASGARLILTLLKELRRRNLKTGLATLCVGGGQGEAIIVEAA